MKREVWCGWWLVEAELLADVFGEGALGDPGALAQGFVLRQGEPDLQPFGGFGVALGGVGVAEGGGHGGGGNLRFEG